MIAPSMTICGSHRRRHTAYVLAKRSFATSSKNRSIVFTPMLSRLILGTLLPETTRQKITSKALILFEALSQLATMHQPLASQHTLANPHKVNAPAAAHCLTFWPALMC